jgi:hypothetical protein
MRTLGLAASLRSTEPIRGSRHDPNGGRNARAPHRVSRSALGRKGCTFGRLRGSAIDLQTGVRASIFAFAVFLGEPFVDDSKRYRRAPSSCCCRITKRSFPGFTSAMVIYPLLHFGDILKPLEACPAQGDTPDGVVYQFVRHCRIALTRELVKPNHIPLCRRRQGIASGLR